MTTGYSGTPLAQKLGLKPGMRAWFQNVPDSVHAEINRDAPPIERLDLPEPPVEFAHIFVRDCAVLDCELRMLLPLLDPAGMIWVSWPKASRRRLSGGQPSTTSRLPTDITEDVIRAVALPLHLVDVKVCAVDETWSGLKLVIRREHRRSAA
jgi:hypothetical protein